ncbi:hypothetical protein [Burkholderia sp. 4M9327F10]|uniref:hypothetical protein n=2 Tax=Burkholderiales TaxID=80840 RepID=UPI002016AF2F|nr:hypothetical protein [Burkholderia sp. 4M9327F10]
MSGAMHVTEPLPGDKRARLVFGLDWRAYPVKGAGAERRRYADDFGATHYVEIKVNGEVLGGFATPDTTGMRGARLYSGAARIALHERIRSRPAALVLLQDEQLVHLVHVVRGAVRSDEALGLEDARNRQATIEAESRRMGLQLTVFGSGASIGDIDEPFHATELLAQKKVGRVSRLPVSIPALVPLALIAVALVVGVTYGPGLISPPPQEHVATWQEQYAAAVANAFRVAPPLASQLAPQLLALGGATDAIRTGWQFDHEDCGSRGNCTVTYLRAGGTFAGFDAGATAGMRPVSFMADGLHLTTKGVAIPKVEGVRPADARNWPSLEEMKLLLQTPAQRLSVKAFELDSYGYRVAIEGTPRPLLAVSPGEAHLGPVIRVGTWEIDGYRWQSPLLARLPPNMALESLTATLQTKAGKNGTAGIRFVAKGKYYVLG